MTFDRLRDGLSRAIVKALALETRRFSLSCRQLISTPPRAVPQVGRLVHFATAIERMFMPPVSPLVLPILMLFASNVFMTFAWYGHLKFKENSLPLVIMVSWGIAFFEYWLAVPANRWGSAVYSAAQLKTMQEVITLIVFAAFSILYLKEPLGWNHVLGFGFIAAGAFFIFHKW
jgi:uncharacterized protein (DUF486 family)